MVRSFMYMRNPQNLYETSDLPLASTLLCLGHKVWATDKADAQRVSFLFERKNGLDGLLESYWRHELLVEPVAFFNALKEAKTRIRNYGETITR